MRKTATASREAVYETLKNPGFPEFDEWLPLLKGAESGKSHFKESGFFAVLETKFEEPGAGPTFNVF